MISCTLDDSTWLVMMFSQEALHISVLPSTITFKTEVILQCSDRDAVTELVEKRGVESEKFLEMGDNQQ